jgi:hypothetical protein
MRFQLTKLLLGITTLALSLTPLPSTAQATWEPLPGRAQVGDQVSPIVSPIGVGSNDSAWVIGSGTRGQGGFGIYRWTGSTWQRVSGAAEDIAVSPNGTPWVVNSSGAVYQWNGSSFQRSSAPCASDIGVGLDNHPWILGCSKVAGGYGIYRLTNIGWQPVSGGAEDIAVSPEGTPWIVNSSGAIYKWNGSSFQRRSGCANDIGVGSNDSAWVVGCGTPGTGGYGIYAWNGSRWIPISGAAKYIAVSPSGTPWIVNSSGTIYRRANSPTCVPGKPCVQNVPKHQKRYRSIDNGTTKGQPEQIR